MRVGLQGQLFGQTSRNGLTITRAATGGRHHLNRLFYCSRATTTAKTFRIPLCTTTPPPYATTATIATATTTASSSRVADSLRTYMQSNILCKSPARLGNCSAHCSSADSI
eukprot:Lankesteria_metandrocarpae@DN3933_c0_g1_i5.p1